MTEIIKKKISDASIPEVSDFTEGFKVLGVNASNQSVKADLKTVGDAANAANSAATSANSAASTATTAAGTATTAASNADIKATLANNAATAANNAASTATTAAGTANTAAGTANDAATAANNAASSVDDKISEMDALKTELEAEWLLKPTSMNLTYPRIINIRNVVSKKIEVDFVPVNVNNVLFLGDENAISVIPDGSIILKKAGNSKVHVVPVNNTSLYKTIDITVVEPGIRNISATSMRFMGSGAIRLT